MINCWCAIFSTRFSSFPDPFFKRSLCFPSSLWRTNICGERKYPSPPELLFSSLSHFPISPSLSFVRTFAICWKRSTHSTNSPGNLLNWWKDKVLMHKEQGIWHISFAKKSKTAQHNSTKSTHPHSQLESEQKRHRRSLIETGESDRRDRLELHSTRPIHTEQNQHKTQIDGGWGKRDRKQLYLPLAKMDIGCERAHLSPNTYLCINT